MVAKLECACGVNDHHYRDEGYDCSTCGTPLIEPWPEADRFGFIEHPTVFGVILIYPDTRAGGGYYVVEVEGERLDKACSCVESAKRYGLYCAHRDYDPTPWGIDYDAQTSRERMVAAYEAKAVLR